MAGLSALDCAVIENHPLSNTLKNLVGTLANTNALFSRPRDSAF